MKFLKIPEIYESSLKSIIKVLLSVTSNYLNETLWSSSALQRSVNLLGTIGYMDNILFGNGFVEDCYCILMILRFH